MKLSVGRICGFFAAIVVGLFLYWLVSTEPVVWQEREEGGTTYFVDGSNKEKTYYYFGVREGELCFYSETRKQEDTFYHTNNFTVGCSDNSGSDALDPGSPKANELRKRLEELKTAIANRRWWQRH